MKIKILETKLQTILEDDDLKITEENIVETIEKILKDKLSKFAKLNEATADIEYYRDEYEDFMSEENDDFFTLTTNTILCILDRECSTDKDKICNLIAELFINQDFYDLMKDSFPSIKKIVDKLNLSDCIFDIENILDWLRDGFDSIQTENIDYESIFEYINSEFEDFNNLFVPDVNELPIVKNKEGDSDEETRSN